LTFQIDTGQAAPQIIPKSAILDEGQAIRFTDATRAERAFRQVIAAIEAHEEPDDLNDYMHGEREMLDALTLFNLEWREDINDAFETQLAALKAGQAWEAQQADKNAAKATSDAPVIAQSSTPKGNWKMFTIDTGDTGGSLGPWISWTSNGSAQKGFAPMSWVLRGKDENDEKFENVIPAFANGCVMDLDSLKLGWEKDGASGMAPERRWNPSIEQSQPRPDDSKKPSGAYAWSQALSVRCAIGDGKAATWEQGSFGAYQAFARLAKQIEQAHPGDNRLPLVKQTGVETKKLTQGNSNTPILEIVDWVARPDCLKVDPPAIATAVPATQQAAPPAQNPAPTPEAQASVPAAASF